MAKNWDDVKSTIIMYYETMTLKEVMVRMSDDHGFKASQRSYRQKFKDWGIRKYRSHESTLSPPSGPSPPKARYSLPSTIVPSTQYAPRIPLGDPFNGWARGYPNGNPAVSIRTPESDSGRKGNGFGEMVPSIQARHGRTGSNVTQVSTSSSQQQQHHHHHLSSWPTAHSLGDGHYTSVSMASPMSMPATTSPHMNPYSPPASHLDSLQLYQSNGYSQPHQQSNIHTQTQSQTPSYATPWSQLSNGAHHGQSRTEYLHRTQAQLPTYPQDGFHNDASEEAKYRYSEVKGYDLKALTRV